MNEVKGRLPHIVENSGAMWKVLKREGNICLIELQPQEGQRKRWDVVTVYVDGDGVEGFRLNLNYDGTRDSPTWDKAAMTAAFQASINKAHALSRQRIREQEQERQKIVIDAAWEKLTNELRDEQSLLVDELKALSRGKTSLSKRSNEIALRLAVLEQIFHHGRPRLEV